MYGLLLKFNHIHAFALPPTTTESPVLYIDAQIYESMLYAAFDCVSTVNNVLAYLIDHLFVYVWAVTQIQSYSTGFSPVLRHGKYPIYWCSDLEMDVIQSVWMRIYCQQCVNILNRSSICVCMGFYSNSIILNRVFTGLASWKISYILTLRSRNGCCTEYLNAHLLSTMC